MNQKLKSKKGITLIALIITVVVLIIITAVTINAVKSDGIIAQVKNASSNYNKSEQNESKSLNTYNIDELAKGNFASKITELNYGEYVKYNVDLNGDGDITNDWRIFYSDNSNVFLIATRVLTDTKWIAESINLVSNNYNGFYWNNGETTAKSTQGVSSDERVKKFMVSWLDSNKNSTKRNACAMADLLNIDAWSTKFGANVSGVVGAEAIAGPTIEMFVASWNKTCGDRPILYVDYTNEGYYIGYTQKPSEEAWVNCAGFPGSLSVLINIEQQSTCYDLKCSDGLYEGTYRLSTLAAAESYEEPMQGVEHVGSNNYLFGYQYGPSVSYGDDFGLRPIVSLPSTVSASKDNTDYWVIK